MPKLFGLDIGSTSIKTVEIAGENKELRLLVVDFIPAPPRGTLSESDIDQQLLAGTIKRLVELAKIDTKFVNVSLPENQVFTRVVQMPVLSDKELSSAIKWESEQYIPLPVASVSLDWEVLTRDKEKNRMDVLLVGAPTNLIAKYQKILGMAGLEIAYMETEIIAASRSLIHFSEKTASTMIINIGATSTDLGVFEDEILIVTYTVPLGGNVLTRTIATEFGFDMNTAEQYKKTYGIEARSLEGKIAAAVKPVLASLLTEVKKAISFYQSKEQNSEIRRIILSGGDAKLPGLPIFFADNLGIETEIANPWKKIRVDENVFKNKLEDGPIYSIATGLALREYG